MLFRFLGFKGVCLSRFSKETQRADGGIVGAQASGSAPRCTVSVSGVQDGGAGEGNLRQHQPWGTTPATPGHPLYHREKHPHSHRVQQQRIRVQRSLFF